jgi:hypothetical protein
MDKTEIILEVIIAGTLTVMQEGACLTSIVNMKEREVASQEPSVKCVNCNEGT